MGGFAAGFDKHLQPGFIREKQASREAVYKKFIAASGGDTSTLGPTGPVKLKNLKNPRGEAPSTDPSEPGAARPHTYNDFIVSAFIQLHRRRIFL